MGSPRLSVAVGSARRSHILSFVSNWHRHRELLALSLSSVLLASAQSLLTPTNILYFVLFFLFSLIFCHSRSIPCFSLSCLLLSIHTLFLCIIVAFHIDYLTVRQGPLKSSHLSVFARFSLFSRSAFFLGISLPVSPRGSPLWITIQFSANYLVAFAAFDT